MKNILCILQVPPPLHGASLVGQTIMNSEDLNSKFNFDFIRISSVPLSEKPGIHRKINTYIRTLRTIKKKLKKSKYDLVYITPCAWGFAFYKDFIISIIVKRFSQNLVYHFHNKGISVNRYVPRFIFKIFFENTKTILLSEKLYYDIQEYVSNENVYYCPNGISNKENIYKDKTSNEEPLKILFLSNMIRSKGVFVLLDACKLLKERGARFECNFAGPWYKIKENEFYEKVRKLGLSNSVKHIGPLYGENKDQEISKCDIFVFPTLDDCFPLVILEAMRLKKAIVSTNVGAIPEIIKNKHEGILIERANSDELADELEKLSNDVATRISIGENAQIKFLKNYTIEHFEDKLYNILSCL